MKHFRRLLSLLLCAVLLLSLAPAAFAEDGAGPFWIRVQVDGLERETAVHAYDATYPYNSYISLTDLSAALKSTSKRFHLKYSYTEADGSVFNIVTGEATSLGPNEAHPEATHAGPMELSLRRNRLFVDGKERRYYTARVNQDLYMSLVDVQLMLDLTMEYTEAGVLSVYPDRPFAPDLMALQADGYFDVFNGVLIGDADSGELYFSYAATRPAPIASLSKLMSYLLIVEAIHEKKISYQDKVPISKAAEILSKSADGMVELHAGTTVPCHELLEAMLLASSNECCLALAEHVSGSEEAFVASMNQRARELGLRSARFYTPHGLPSYPESGLPIKRQNVMSPTDLFTLSAYILENYPEITDVTGKLYGNMPTLNYTTANSNPLVFNLEGVTGLKTGSTTRAGYCLVVSLPLKSGDETHTLIMVLLGSEMADVRGQAAEILLRSARDHYLAEGFADAA